MTDRGKTQAPSIMYHITITYPDGENTFQSYQAVSSMRKVIEIVEGLGEGVEWSVEKVEREDVGRDVEMGMREGGE